MDHGFRPPLPQAENAPELITSHIRQLSEVKRFSPFNSLTSSPSKKSFFCFPFLFSKGAFLTKGWPVSLYWIPVVLASENLSRVLPAHFPCGIFSGPSGKFFPFFLAASFALLVFSSSMDGRLPLFKQDPPPARSWVQRTLLKQYCASCTSFFLSCELPIFTTRCAFS